MKIKIKIKRKVTLGQRVAVSQIISEHSLDQDLFITDSSIFPDELLVVSGNQEQGVPPYYVTKYGEIEKTRFIERQAEFQVEGGGEW